MSVYNSQLVTSLLSAIDRLNYSADYGVEDVFELYHKIQEQNERRGPSTDGIGLPALGHAVAGSAGTALSHIILYPLDLVITRLQVQQQLKQPGEAPSAAKEADDAEYTSLADAARKIYTHEGGLQAFWNGCAADTAKSIIDSFLFFLAYTAFRQRQQKKLGTKSLPVFNELSVGIAAGALSKFVTTPIQQIVTRKQTAALIAARDKTSTVPPGMASKLSVKDIFLQIRSERGLGGFWAGYSASLILTLNPALTFLLQNLLKRTVLPRSQRDKPGPKALFLIAALSKAIASTVTYPFSLAKSRAQVSRPMAEDTQRTPPSYLEKPDLSSDSKITARSKKVLRLVFWQQIQQLAIVRSLVNIYNTEGVKGLYSGLDAEVVKGFLGHGLSMVLKERIHVLIISAYYAILKATKQWPHDLGSVSEQAKSEFERVKGVAVDMAESAVEAGKEAGHRVQNVGETVVEGVKNAVESSNVGESVQNVSSNVDETVQSVSSNVSERVQNISETVVEGVKNSVKTTEEKVPVLFVFKGGLCVVDWMLSVTSLNCTGAEASLMALMSVDLVGAILLSVNSVGAILLSVELAKGEAMDWVEVAVEADPACCCSAGAVNESSGTYIFLTGTSSSALWKRFSVMTATSSGVARLGSYSRCSNSGGNLSDSGTLIGVGLQNPSEEINFSVFQTTLAQ
ncbi:hypothetical protein KCU61_g265, partial [Aureobasidium melanogenum]